MEYTISRLARLTGVSTRTLRYYNELELLLPARITSNGYRVYSQKEVDRLQQILLFRELGVPLSEIKRIISSKDFNRTKVLQNHLIALLDKRAQLDLLINNVEKTIKETKGEIIMSNKEKFDGFTQELVNENEQQYGKEIRAKYGNAIVDSSHEKVRLMSKEQYADIEKLSAELNDMLKAGVDQGDPSSELAQKACELHKNWLCHFWDSYSKEAHLGVTQMYVDDPRFTKYYDKIANGCAIFLRDAVLIYCKSNEQKVFNEL